MSKLTEKEKEIARLSINDIINSTELPEMIDSDLNKVDKVLDKSSISDLTETYDGIKNRAHIKAVRTIDSLLRFYLSEEIIEEEEYIRAKVEMDKMALSKLVWLMETSERSITTLMKTIDSGDMDSKMFEVLGGLQKTMLDIIKSQTMFLVASEESMKKLSRDLDVYGKESSRSKLTVGEKKSITTRGTKDLMKALLQIGAEEKTNEENIEYNIIEDGVINDDTSHISDIFNSDGIVEDINSEDDDTDY